MSSMQHDTLFWRVGDSIPDDLPVDPFSSFLIPKPTVWISVNNHEVSLLEGYNVANQAPPILMMASDALSVTMLKDLEDGDGYATLSVATLREQHCFSNASQSEGEARPMNFSFKTLGLSPDSTKVGYPPGVMSSPVKMYCKLFKSIDLGNTQNLLLLEVDAFVISSCVLSKPDEASARQTLAKVDAELMEVVASLGSGQFATMESLRIMPRPEFANECWSSGPFAAAAPTLGLANLSDVEYVFHNDTSKLGYNPLKAIVIPRPIGWISTYSDESRAIPHLAPYSFFTDVGRGSRPLVAFSSYRSPAVDNGNRKDAQLDTETMGCFCVNLVSEDLAVPMNLTSGELKRTESEFEVSGLTYTHATMVNAPFVDQAHCVMEGRYVKTVDVGAFSVVIGEIVGMHINKFVLRDGKVDAIKLKPVTRLGNDEYAVINRYLNNTI